MARIVAQGISVSFPIYGGSSRSLKNTMIRAATGGLLARDSADRVVVQALNGLSFVINDGDRVGLIGHNGSGKTTLLRVLAGAYEPVSGSLTIEGRVASMLNITLGMDLEATGQENVYMRAALMGLRTRDIEPLVAQIHEFAELGDYFHMPLRTYSSGMAMRLAFAISTCVDADILLMDEWLSVGDVAFTAKAEHRLEGLLGRARILVLASHDESLIKRSCNRIFRLSHGELVSQECIAPALANAA